MMNIRLSRRRILAFALPSLVILLALSYKYHHANGNILLLNGRKDSSQPGKEDQTYGGERIRDRTVENGGSRIHLTDNQHLDTSKFRHANEDHEDGALAGQEITPSRRSSISEATSSDHQSVKPPTGDLAIGNEQTGPFIIDIQRNNHATEVNSHDIRPTYNQYQQVKEDKADNDSEFESQTLLMDASDDEEESSYLYDMESSLSGLSSPVKDNTSVTSGKSWTSVISAQQNDGAVRSYQLVDEDFGSHTNLTQIGENLKNHSVRSFENMTDTHPDQQSGNQSVGLGVSFDKHKHTQYFLSKTTPHRKVNFSIKEDVVMEMMSNYTHMPPVDRAEFLQLQANGIIRRNVSQKLFNLAPEVFMKTPLTFSTRTKGPCWFVNNVTAQPQQRMRCLPYFYLIGMPKCGTTDMYEKITEHPAVVRLQKEPHWWTRRRFRLKGQRNAKKSYDDYLHHYSDLVEAIFNDGKPDVYIGGDGSASTMWNNVKNMKVNLLPELIHKIQPEVKLIAVLREPVERLYSDYVYFHTEGANAESLHKQVEETISDFTKCTKHYPLRYCAGQKTSAQRARVTLGLYSVFIADWLRVFPRDSIMIFRLRDWNKECLTLLPKIFAFLEIETLKDSAIKRICKAKKKNVTHKDKFPILNSTFELLSDFYRPYNKELAALLQDERYLWLY
ncbi:uncharacterized protein LOC129278624 [Lytechinus pictus]|uniref:uncharacterized protein LOC129278624 n=1 Tax=Lytechinus pictus TaxID=7653 RepID=UPI0030B9B237